MKKTIVSAAILLTGLATAFGQLENGSYNPYLIQADVSPAPMLPAEFNGTGTLFFDVGNTGFSDIVLVPGQEMRLTITLSYGVPDNVDPVAAVSGPGSEWFSWEYVPATRTYRAKQKTTIPGDSRKTVYIAYKVVENSFKGQSYKNGFNINIAPPAYTGGQPTDDDSIAVFTYVRAYDFGDAPLSYGEAWHEINFSKTGGLYNKYMYLGASVDHEPAYQASDLADADNDDGVTFPRLVANTTVNIPVTLTLWDYDPDNPPPAASLRGWIDWDKDGSFASTTERFVNFNFLDYLDNEGVEAWTGPQTFVFNFPVTIPADAVGSYFSRFRFGPLVIPTASADYGEVEDYLVTIQLAPITIGDFVWLDDNGNGVMDDGEPGVSNVVVRLLDASLRSGVEVTQTVTSVDGSYQFTDLPPGSYQVEVVRPAGYAFTLPNAVAELPVSGVAQDTGLSPVISATESGTHVPMSAGIYMPAALSGWLFVDKNGDKLYNLYNADSDDMPITNEVVTLTVNGVTLASTNSNAEGFYSFADVPPGAVTLLVSRAEAALVGVPAGDDPMRNRALPGPDAPTAFISYNIASGYGVLETLPGETLNFGFTVHPLSTQIDLRVYAAADGRVMIEIATVNENGKYAIEIYALIDGDWKPVATVPSEQVVGFGSNTYTVEAVGLTPGESYRFKIVDESGHIFESDLIEVARSLLAVEAMTLMPEMVKVVFRTKPGMAYQVMVCEALGTPWKAEYVQRKTARGYSALTNEPFFAGRDETTEVLVPRNQRAAAFFKIIQIQ